MGIKKDEEELLTESKAAKKEQDQMGLEFLEQMKRQRDEEDKAKLAKGIYCNICNKWCNSDTQMKEHKLAEHGILTHV